MLQINIFLVHYGHCYSRCKLSETFITLCYRSTFSWYTTVTAIVGHCYRNLHNLKKIQINTLWYTKADAVILDFILRESVITSINTD